MIIRIGIAISDAGDWTARGYPAADDEQLRQDLIAETEGDNVHVYFAETDVPVPDDSPLQLELDI